MMINFDYNEYCSGCTACYSVCPTGAITMTNNEEGFLIPVVSAEKCTDCGLCEKVCVHLNNNPAGAVCGSWTYASQDEEAKGRSSSGAAWFELGKGILKRSGVIAGCIWDDALRAKHMTGENEQALTATQGSKYVQSEMQDVLKKIVKSLKVGQKVIFSGTPCQATAAHNVIMNSSAAKHRDNALIIGIICHGVASPKAWESFKAWDESVHNSKLVSVNFRDKTKEGYKKCYCRYEYASGEVTYLPTFLPSSKWMEATIVYNLAMRNSCAHCDCKGENGAIDLVLGDWYAEYTGEGTLGTSCIVAFTERGKAYAEHTLTGLRKLKYSSILEKNSLIETSSEKSPRRQDFFNYLKDGNNKFWESVERLYPPKYKYKCFLVRIGLYDVLKQFIG